MIICIFGDSIAWGANDREKGGWVERLKTYFAQKGNFETEVYNLGVSGNKVADVLARIDHEASARNPDTIILAVGINDSPHQDYPNGTDLSDFKKQYADLVSRAQKHAKRVVVVGLTHVNESVEYKNEKIEKYNQAIKEIAQSEGLPFVALNDLLSDADLDDGLHPNSQGHQKIFEKVKEGFENS